MCGWQLKDNLRLQWKVLTSHFMQIYKDYKHMLQVKHHMQNGFYFSFSFFRNLFFKGQTIPYPVWNIKKEFVIWKKNVNYFFIINVLSEYILYTKSINLVKLKLCRQYCFSLGGHKMATSYTFNTGRFDRFAMYLTLFILTTDSLHLS